MDPLTVWILILFGPIAALQLMITCLDANDQNRHK